MNNQSRYEVVTPVARDALATALQSTFVIDHEEVDDLAPPREDQPLPPVDHGPVDHVQGASVPPPEVGGDNVEVMRAELTSAHDTIAKQNGELARLRAKCLALENQASSGK